MAKVKVIKNNLDQNLNGDNFENSASQTIFKFGSFNLTSNFNGRTFIDYSKELNTFVRPVTLETLDITTDESTQINKKTNYAVLNLDRSDLNTFTKFGSAYEFIRVSIENIILNYPGSLFISSQVNRGGNVTFYDFEYDPIKNITKFKIPSPYTINKFELIYNYGNNTILNGNKLKNLNLSYNDYVVWSTQNSSDNGHIIIGFTGDTSTRPYLMVECIGNPFPFFTGTSNVGKFDFHLKPNTRIFDNFRENLTDYQKYIISKRLNNSGFEFTIKDPTLLDDGTISYTNRNIVWVTGDGYNIDYDTPNYKKFLEIILSVANKYDQIKTDLIARFLTPVSLQTYDLTEDKKISKLLRIYGAEFDQLKQFIDSLVYINRTTYDKKKNIPDQLISNLAKTFGWEFFQLVKEEELVDKLLGFAESERNLHDDLTPPDIDIELWRRILINTNYFWKSKGTRDAIKSMFLLIGIPEPFINITEYVYTVDGRIDPRSVKLTLNDLPSASLPYDDDGYPIAPIETSDFYFQISGDSDNGQAYMNNFRNVGFDLQYQVDNKKSWIQTGSTYRYHYSSPTYHQKDSKLVLNTKEVDIALDTTRGVEYDVYRYIKEIDFPANSTGFTLPFTYVNLSLDVANPQQNQFTLPIDEPDPEGDVEIRFNGVLLNGPKYWDGTTVTSGNSEVDYYFISPKTFKLGSAVYGDIYARNDGINRDVIEATYLYRKGSGLAQVTVKYIVVRIAPSILQATIPLPETPNGDVQLTINGIAATKGTPQFIADYIVDGDNIIIQNPDLIAYFATNPYVQVAYITVTGSSDIYARQEINRVDSFCGGKVYFNTTANRAVYRLNYKIINENSVKILVDGVALEPQKDYFVNPNNPYEIFLPPGINLGSVISAYYIVGDSAAFDPIIDDNFGLGDITQLSFLEFIELIQKRLINATNRKVITDFKGGWYPTLFKIYATYLHRSTLNSDDPLKSNGYTFENLYSFLNKYNAFFQKFVNQLLPATIIQRKGGLLIRNTIFTKQKFTYKRGVNFDSTLNYFGSDDAIYLKRPLQQIAEWTDDRVCLPNLCENFIVKNVTITYPTTTTTTTQPPFNSAMLIEPFSFTYTPITDGYSATEIFTLGFTPNIPPGYTVNVKLDFEITLNNSGATGTANTIAEVTVQNNNGSPIYQQLRQNTNNNNYFITDTTNITIGVGDIIKITLFNSAVAELSSNVISTTKLIPTILSVIPNGIIGSVIPTSVDNIVNSQIIPTP